jgi:hypothetical protein
MSAKRRSEDVKKDIEGGAKKIGLKSARFKSAQGSLKCRSSSPTILKPMRLNYDLIERGVVRNWITNSHKCLSNGGRLDPCHRINKAFH